MASLLILNANIVNEGRIFTSDLLIKNGRIDKIGTNLSGNAAETVIDVVGKYLLPGVIDDQVHFREPGLTHKATIYSESKAAVAGGVTSFMEMPNTVPNALTQELLEDKYQIAAQSSLANYSFYIGAGYDNTEEVLKTDPERVCGVKIFMGSSTGNMLVDDPKVLEKLFSECEILIATHCEDEQTVRSNLKLFEEKYGKNIPVECHPEIRSVEACLKSSSEAVNLAKKHGTRLHVLHITTAEETLLFDNTIPLKDKKITSEVCVHHLWFDALDYEKNGAYIKCNPAVKEARHKEALLTALLDDRLDVIATDHAPHTADEKDNLYTACPSGIPTVQHSLLMMLEFYKKGKISLEKIVEKMCHAPAECFRIKERGFIREGWHADLVLVDLDQNYTVTKENLLYKCGWYPLEGHKFNHSVTHTIVSGHLAYSEGKFNESKLGERLLFKH